MGSGSESSNLKCLADKWSNMQILSTGSDFEFSNPIEPEVRFRHFAHTMGNMLINKVVEHIANGALRLGFDSLAGQIRHRVAKALSRGDGSHHLLHISA